MSNSSLQIIALAVISLFLSSCTILTHKKTTSSPQAPVVEKVLEEHRETTGQLSAEERRKRLLPRQPQADKDQTVPLPESTNVDYNCSWFYFLWGTQAEYDERYEEAYSSYEKALACDPQSPYVEQKLPMLLLRMNRLDEAADWLKEILQNNPENIDYLQMLAGIYLRQDKIQQGLDIYKTIYSLSPDDENIVAQLAIIYVHEKEYQTAKNLLLSYLTIHPDAVFPRLTLARIYAEEKKLDLAIGEYKKILKNQWTQETAGELAVIYRFNKQNDEAEKIYRTILINDNQNEKVTFALISLLTGEKRFDDALKELEHLRVFSNDTDKIDFIRSKIYLNENKPELAIPILKSLLHGSVHNDACYLLGKITFQENKLPASLNYFKLMDHSSELFPQSVLMQIKIYKRVGKEGKAASYLKSCIRDKENRHPLFYALLASLMQEKKKIAPAEEVLKQGLVAFPNDTQLMYELGLFYEREKQHDKAVEVMEKVIQIDPNHPDALNFLGYSWAEANENLSKAYQYIEKANTLKPKNGFILDSLGWVLFRQGKYEQAVSVLQDALKNVPGNPLILEHLGDVYRAMKKTNEARTCYQNAVKEAGHEDLQRITKKLIELK